MATKVTWNRPFIGCLLLALLAGCATAVPETPTPEPTAAPIDPTATPGPSSCEEVEGVCIVLSFDSEKNCMYSGPSEVKTGPITLIFLNDSGLRTAANLMRHLGDQTIQDMIDSLGEEPFHGRITFSWIKHAYVPPFIRSGETYAWQGDLRPGIHSILCSSPEVGHWYGGGFSVED